MMNEQQWIRSTRIPMLSILTMLFIFLFNGTEIKANFIETMITTQQATEQAEAFYELEVEDETFHSWIVKWNGQPEDTFWQHFEMIKHVPDLNASVVRPLQVSVEETDVIQRWSSSPYIQYIQPNHRVHIAAHSNDPLSSLQNHLSLIGAPKAWEIERQNTAITIALIDTGVDFNHPDLKPNLLPGINLLDKDVPPQDDNGHGTNVAGVLAAAGNNSEGVTGVLWNAKIMPIKAIEANGYGDEMELGEGIRYAVDNGAKIVVLPLGLYKYSPFMEEITRYAENRGVLLVAASGNDGEAVKYPAAYPTVLAVGGMVDNKRVAEKSNRGPEIDVVAPWRVYTTTNGGGYGYEEGTSMATPQVAGVAALILAKYPDLKPHEVRSLIRQTAEDISGHGWNEQSGYGLVRADRALSEPLKSDIYEPNDRMDTSKPLPIGSMISGTIGTEKDRDWFYYRTEYNGEISIRIQTDRPLDRRKLKITYYESSGAKGIEYANLLDPIRLPASNEKSYIVIEAMDNSLTFPVPYRLTAEFHIAPDPFENNDRQFQAYLLPARNQVITGNFHQVNDVDWYVLHAEQEGTLRVSVSTDTFRIDPELWIQRQGEQPIVVDSGKWGETEYSSTINVTPGKYYFRVRNVISPDAYPVAGEYQLSISYEQKFTDPNEPNNRAFQATRMLENKVYQGVLHPNDDLDWFSFQVNQDSVVTVRLSSIPKNRILSLSLYDGKQNQLMVALNNLGVTELKIEKMLVPGNYLIRLSANESFQNQQYRLEYKAEPLISGFRDIGSHWAKEQIIHFVNEGIVAGYSDYSFRPDRAITRAEATLLLYRTFDIKATGTSVPRFADMNRDHWAYNATQQLYRAGIVSGYPDNTFRPDRPLSRIEMTALVARALQLNGSARMAPFSDVPATHWGRQLLNEMYGKGWANGYPDGSFQPNKEATRAEFITMLYQVLK